MSEHREPQGPDLYTGSNKDAGARGSGRGAGVVTVSRSPGASVRLFIGAALVLFGVTWTLDNLGWSGASEALRWWPVLVLAFGVLRLTGWAGMTRHAVHGSFFTVLGLLLVLARIAHLPVGLGLAFPLLIIFVGATFASRSLRGEKPWSSREDPEDVLRVTAIIGATSIRSVARTLRRGEMDAVMGGIELDLRDARPVERRIEMDVFACMGGIDITVPDTWTVESDIVPILGGFENKTRRPVEGTEECTLVLRGSAVMGGIEARNRKRDDAEVNVIRRRRDTGEDSRGVQAGSSDAGASTASRTPAAPGPPPPPPVDPS